MTMLGSEITDDEFDRLRRFFETAPGICLNDSKRQLVCGRLSKRLRTLSLTTYSEYLGYIGKAENAMERQTAVDLLTTNETHFFREPRHFDRLRDEILTRLRLGDVGQIRIWSAASSTGEEPYSLAMTLAELLGDRPWSITASDLSTKVLADAQRAIYGRQRAEEVPTALATKYLLEGFDEYEGMYRIDPVLCRRVTFRQINLMEPLPMMESFDYIFLRNVLIYFDVAAKRRIVEAVAQKLKPSGLLFIGHSETLSGVTDVVRQVVPTVYRRE
jgi:chemotaxis protein methyltransferase CheR